MPRHDYYFAAWAIVLPITSILLLPSVQGTTPGYLFALAVICPPISVLVIPKDMLLRFYYDLILFVLLYAALNAIAQLSLSFSQTALFPLNLPLVDSLDADRRILMRKTMFTQSLYVLAAASTFFFVKRLYSIRWDKFLFSGAIVFAIYGLYEWSYFLVFGDSGDFLSNRTFDGGNLFGVVHTGSWFQIIHLGPLTVQRLKSLAGEPSMYAFAILPFWIYALHTNRTFTHVLLLITLLLSTSTTAMLGIFVYFIVRLWYFGLADKIVFVSFIVFFTVLAMGLSGNTIVLDIYSQIVENKFTLQSTSGANRYDVFLDTTDFFLNGSLLTQVFGVGNGYVRSTDFFSTILVNLGVVGLIMTTWIFVYPVLKLGNTEAEVGLKAAVLTMFITLMVAVPEYTSLPLSLFLGIAYSYISKPRSLLSSVSRRPEIQTGVGSKKWTPSAIVKETVRYSMEKLPRQLYTKEFREQAARLVLEEGLSVPEAARRLSMSAKTLANWVHWTRSGKLGDVGANRKPVTELEAELARLQRELAEVKMERDISKKATAYFAKGSPGGKR